MIPGLFVRRFFQAFAVAAVLIGLAQYLKGRPVDFCIREALVWGLVTAAVYTSVLAYKLRHLFKTNGASTD